MTSFFLLVKVPYTTLLTSFYDDKNLNTMKHKLESECDILLKHSGENQMQANSEKFQAIAVGKKTFSELRSFTVANSNTVCKETVKLLGSELDYQLNFNEQVSRFCQKVARQLNVLQRISNFLSEDTRLLVLKFFIR